MTFKVIYCTVWRSSLETVLHPCKDTVCRRSSFYTSAVHVVFLLVVFNGLKDLFVIHRLTSHLVSGGSSCRTRGAQKRGTTGGHCRASFEPNTITSDSRRVWEHVSSIIIARVTCVRTLRSWYHRMLEPGKQLHVLLKYTLMLFLFHRNQLLYDFMQAPTLLQCRSEDLMHKTHTNTHTHRWTSPLWITQKHSRIPSDLVDLRLRKLFALFPLQTRYLMPVVALTVVFNIYA